jgi:hypothetical protein
MAPKQSKASNSPHFEGPPKRICKTLRENVWRQSHASSGQGTCVMCQRTVTVWEFDVCHRKSRNNGGTLDLGNLVVGCHECNKRQGVMDMDEYIKIRRVSSTEDEAAPYQPAPTEEITYKEEWMALQAAEKEDSCSGATDARAFLGREATTTKLQTVRCALSDLSVRRRTLSDLTFIERIELKRITGLAC